MRKVKNTDNDGHIPQWTRDEGPAAQLNLSGPEFFFAQF
jgi:hypothetical protein